MFIVDIFLGVAVSALLVVMSWRFASRFAGVAGQRLPLVVTLDCTGPKWLVLGLIPALGMIVMSAVIVGQMHVPAEHQMEGGLILSVIGLIFLAAQGFHLLLLSEQV